MALTEEQRNAILKQSEGMTTEEKKIFAGQINDAQKREEAKTMEPIIEEPIKTEPINGLSYDDPASNVVVKKEEPYKLSEKQKEAIETKSEGMTTDEKKTFSDDINKAKTEATTNNNIPISIGEWKERGSDIASLEEMIETKYGTVVENKNGVLSGEINGTIYEWRIDDAGNPIKTKVAVAEEVVNEETINMSQNDVFNNLMNGIGEGLDEKTPEWKIANRRVNNYNNQDKSEDGFYTSLVNGTFDASLISVYNKTEQYAQAYKQANARFLKENFDKLTLKDILNATAGEQAAYLKVLFPNLGFGVDYQKKVDDNEELQKYKDGVFENNKTYLTLKGEMDNLRNKIKGENPNASPSLLAALYNRQAQGLITKGNEALAAAGANKMSYDIEIGEMKMVNDAEKAQADSQSIIYRDLLNKQYGAYTAEALRLKQIETAKVNAGGIKKWLYNKDGNLTGLDNKGNVISTLSGYSTTDGNDWKWKETESGWTGFKWNSETDKPIIVAYNKEGNLIREYGKFGNMSISGGISGNVPDRNNNPFNAKLSPTAIAALGYTPEVDRQGHMILKTPEDGLKAGLADIDAKIAGRTTNKHILAGIEKDGYVSLATLGKGWATDSSWGVKVASLLGVNPLVNVSTIDRTELAKAIAEQEGFTGSIKFSSEVEGKGNKAFKNIKPKDYKALSNLNIGFDNIAKIEEMAEYTTTGFYRATSRNFGKYFPEWFVDKEDIDFDRMSSLVIDNLAQYIKNISGATVSNTERTQLEKVMPTMSDNPVTFKLKLAEFKAKLTSTLNTEAMYRGFDSIESMNNALGIKGETGGKVYDIN